MQHVQEFLNYAKYVLWWVSLGVASSIGLGKFHLHHLTLCIYLLFLNVFELPVLKVLCHVAARLSGSEAKAVKELDSVTSKDDGRVASTLNRTKRWLLSHSQHLNFFTILILASVGLMSSMLSSQFLCDIVDAL
ncbi:hypothetical protein PR202_gb04564 [Eleusine coracana subsp. coracana]|uniref:Reticulon-like protein n=1 Tax=Eleusine coracana subsp. coracana TaxID=191504 RepID=A0AAV5E460_ELECO|nr:hypothetical protein PR202_gb04564 [Eleusine coracana subsp. coracana]